MNLQAILDHATDPQWEAYVQRSKRMDIQMRGNGTEALIRQENTGYGVRVIVPRSGGSGVGFASCNSEKDLETTARRAHDLAKLNQSPSFELPEKQKLPLAKTVDRKILDDHESAAKQYAEQARKLISREKDISLTFGKVRTYIVETEVTNSQGLSCRSTGTYVFLEMTFKVGNGSTATEFWPTRYARRLSDLDPNRIIPEWLTIAKSSLKRHPPKTKEMTVIFSPSLVCDSFIPTIGYHSTGEALKLNLSKFRKGEKVAAEELTVEDDGLYPYGLRTKPFDDEGQPQQKTTVIAKGIFKNYIYDKMHADTMSARPTGNGIRSGFGTDVDDRFQVLPANNTTNLSISPGDQTLDELIEDIKDGLLIYNVGWLNPDEITTRFGTEIRNAQEIKDGQLGEGVVGGTVSGSVLQLLQGISGISDEHEIVSAYAFGCVAPYIRFERVQISGPS